MAVAITKTERERMLSGEDGVVNEMTTLFKATEPMMIQLSRIDIEGEAGKVLLLDIAEMQDGFPVIVHSHIYRAETTARTVVHSLIDWG